MVQSVELLLDAATEEAVLGQWRALAEADLPSQARHTGATNRPHVTLAAVDEVDPAAEARLAAALAGTWAAGVPLPLPLRLGPLVVLGGRRHVLARLVVVTAPLLALHAAVQAALPSPPGSGQLLAPGAWTPHVTLARGLQAEQLARSPGVLRAAAGATGAGGAAGADGLPEQGAAVAVRRFDGDEKVTWLVAGRDPLGRTPATRPVEPAGPDVEGERGGGPHDARSPAVADGTAPPTA